MGGKKKNQGKTQEDTTANPADASPSQATTAQEESEVNQVLEQNQSILPS
jgi:hypothetical protein